MRVFKFKLITYYEVRKEIFNISTLAAFQALSCHVCLVATVLDNADLGHSSSESVHIRFLNFKVLTSHSTFDSF